MAYKSGMFTVEYRKNDQSALSYHLILTIGIKTIGKNV